MALFPSESADTSAAGEAAAVLREFVQRIDAFDTPTPDAATVVEIAVGGQVVGLRPPVVRAFAEALRTYQDPRDRGTCDHCGGPRLDDNFICADCGQSSGVFGQLLRERAARYEPPDELPG
ncbi:hypothetical protein GCM10010399_11850 [Dactylosporangium fulvum]|uniref:Uncharacterized protein n=1 Tax=Dactylosporangium fulvum TaxID=53359 RepID=A0ABY5W4L2_9ACTN|nr:hypothetical protein [Dactylosporangium fulvum]UWP84399.1 hypothetical protein Dfulv_09240 [Dactylosporangium fulvum]